MLRKMYRSHDWHSVHIPVWKEYLAPILDGRPVQALEIGSYEGRSSCWILDNMLKHPNSRLTCVDTWDGRHDIEGLQTVEAETNDTELVNLMVDRLQEGGEIILFNGDVGFKFADRLLTNHPKLCRKQTYKSLDIFHKGT